MRCGNLYIRTVDIHLTHRFSLQELDKIHTVILLSKVGKPRYQSATMRSTHILIGVLSLAVTIVSAPVEKTSAPLKHRGINTYYSDFLSKC